MAETAQEKFLKDQLEKERKSHGEVCKEWREREASLQADLHRARDLAAAEAHRADLAEERIGRLRDLIEHGNDLGARNLARGWDREKRRARG